MKKLIFYFLQGLLFTIPVFVTLYILFKSLQWIDSLIEVPIPGLGLILIISLITLLGFLGKFLFATSLYAAFEKLLEKTPLVKIVYTSTKDLINAFVGEKKRFSQPVLVMLNRDSGVEKIGFITREDLSVLGVYDKVAVYLPHSYNFSGNLFIVPRENVKLLNVSGTETMKFIVSAGVTELH
jgi:uncharacterized membrane protein